MASLASKTHLDAGWVEPFYLIKTLTPAERSDQQGHVVTL